MKIPQAIEESPKVKTSLAKLRTAQAAYDAAERTLTKQRLATIRTLQAQGLSYGQIGQLVGMTKSRVFQLATREDQ